MPLLLAQLILTALRHCQRMVWTVVARSVASTGRKSLRAWAVINEISDAHSLAEEQLGGVASLSRAVSGRNVVVL
jgi:hypothetical protein